MPFRTQPEIAILYGRDLMILHDRLEYFDYREHQLFVIEEGFIYDGASIPKPLWSIIGSPFDADFRLPSALHEFLYRNEVISKERADQMFYDALRGTGVGYLKAQSMYLAVKLFGRGNYDKKMEKKLSWS